MSNDNQNESAPSGSAATTRLEPWTVLSEQRRVHAAGGADGHHPAAGHAGSARRAGRLASAVEGAALSGSFVGDKDRNIPTVLPLSPSPHRVQPQSLILKAAPLHAGA